MSDITCIKYLLCLHLMVVSVMKTAASCRNVTKKRVTLTGIQEQILCFATTRLMTLFFMLERLLFAKNVEVFKCKISRSIPK